MQHIPVTCSSQREGSHTVIAAGLAFGVQVGSPNEAQLSMRGRVATSSRPAHGHSTQRNWPEKQEEAVTATPSPRAVEGGEALDPTEGANGGLLQGPVGSHRQI